MKLQLFRSNIFNPLSSSSSLLQSYCLGMLLTFCLTPVAMADTVWLENDDVISGEVIGLDAGNLKFKTTYAGEITISWRHVRTLKTDKPLWVNLIGEDTARLRELRSDGDDFIIVDPDGYERKFRATWPVASIAQTEPVLEDSWDFGGNVALSLENKNGNDIESRYRMDGTINIDDQWNKNQLKWQVDVERKDEGVWKKNVWELGYDYSRYFNEHWFTNASAKMFYHSRDNLQRRLNIGGFYGYRFRETTSEALLVSMGLSHIVENYESEGEQSSLALGWKLFHRRYLVKNLEFYIDIALYYRMQNQQWIWDSEQGLRYKMTDNLSFNVTQNLDYDSLPGEEEKKLDSQLKFGIGYNW